MIPIKNLYYLLLYAWDELDSADLLNVAELRSQQPIDLLGHVLAKGVERVLKHGLDHEYVVRNTAETRVRGKLDFGATIKGASRARGQVICVTDELSSDALQNRIIKETLRSLANDAEVDSELRR